MGWWKMARELAPHRKVVPPADLDVHQLANMLAHHMQQLESMVKKLQRDIPIFVDEYLYMQNATTLTLLPQSQNLELITCIFAVVSAAGGATLTLGGATKTQRIIPLPQGNTLLRLGENGMLLNNGDTRQIVQGTAGALGLELFGLELPDKGAF